MPHKQKILPALSFVSVLSENSKDIYDILSSLCLFALKDRNMIVFDREEATTTINTCYGFDLPFSIVKGAINRLCANKFCEKKSKGRFRLLSETNDIYKELKSDLDSSTSMYDELIKSLVDFINVNFNVNILSEDIVELKEALHDEIVHGKTSKKIYIDLFLIKNQDNKETINLINNIKKGAVIYNGVCSTPNLNELGKWEHELRLFLATDVLFSAFGINGELMKKRTLDFFDLVKEINEKREKIYFYVLSETSDEIDNFFRAAESIVASGAKADRTKPGMMELIKDCSTKNDVIEKKAKFLQFVKSLHCSKYNKPIGEDIVQYYLSTADNIASIKEECKQSQVDFHDDDEIFKAFSLLEKINYYRKGISNCRFIDAKFFYVTNKNLTNIISQNNKVKISDRDITLSINVNFLTEKFWFALNKGFKSSKTLASFDMVARAKAAISTQLANSVHKKFVELHERKNKGELDEDLAKEMYREYISRVVRAEHLSPEMVPEIVEYISEESIEQYIEEKSMLKNYAQKGIEAIKNWNR